MVAVLPQSRGLRVLGVSSRCVRIHPCCSVIIPWNNVSGRSDPELGKGACLGPSRRDERTSRAASTFASPILIALLPGIVVCNMPHGVVGQRARLLSQEWTLKSVPAGKCLLANVGKSFEKTAALTTKA